MPRALLWQGSFAFQMTLPARDEDEIRWDHVALQAVRSMPGAAVSVGDGDQVNPVQRAYIVHPDVAFSQAVAAGLTLQFEGL
jgi:hypothetical protein